MKGKILLLLLFALLLPMSQPASALTYETINLGQTKTVVLDENTYLVNYYLEVTSEGTYTIEYTLPDVVQEARFSVFNDVDISLENFVSFGFAAPLASDYASNSLDDANDNTGSLSFQVYSVPADGKSVGLVIELYYQWDDVANPTSNNELKLNYFTTALTTTSVVTETFTLDSYNYETHEVSVFLPQVAQDGYYNLTMTTTTDAVEDYYTWNNAYVSSQQYGFGTSLYTSQYGDGSDTDTEYMQLFAGDSILAELNIEVENNNDPLIQVNVIVTFQITLTTPVVLSSGSNQVQLDGGYQLLQLPSFSDILDYSFSEGDSSYFQVQLITTYSSTIYYTGSSYYSPMGSLVRMGITNPGVNYSVKNSVIDIPQVEDIFDQVMQVSPTSDTYLDTFDGTSFSHNMGVRTSIYDVLKDTMLYLQVSGQGTLNIELSDRSATSYTFGTKLTESFTNGTMPNIYKASLDSSSEVITASGMETFNTPDITPTPSYQSYSGGASFAALTPQGPIYIPLGEGSNFEAQSPIFSSGDIYFVADYNGYADIEDSGVVTIPDNPLSVDTELTLTTGSASDVSLDTSFNLDFGLGRYPKSMIKAFDVKEGKIYELSGSGGPFSGSDSNFFAGSFITTDNGYPFRELMPFGLGLGISDFSMTYTAVADARVYFVSFGWGQFDLSINEVGTANIDTAGPGAFLPGPGFALVMGSLVAIYAMKRRR